MVNLGPHGLNHVRWAKTAFVKLLKLHDLVDLGGFEPPTPWLQTMCSPN